MLRLIFRALLPLLIGTLLAIQPGAGLAYQLASPPVTPSEPTAPQADTAAPAAAGWNPVFRFPVVSGVVVSGYFDHHPSAGRVTFYDGRQNTSASYGFYFSCSTPSMYDFVGCADSVSGEAACANNRELWYDGHKGIDYEFAANWHTGAFCDPNRFAGITKAIYAPAAGRVSFAGYDPGRPGNGWHIRIKHDLNRNGNFDDDGMRSNFLHFTANALAVQTGEYVSDGQYLGLGGSTGYSSSPHLHFEVQRSSDNFSSSVWSVDPYGWQGAGSDPWPYSNISLWRFDLRYRYFVALAIRDVNNCNGCSELLGNNGFEGGSTIWTESGVDVIANENHPNLPITPFDGSWLGWLGGRNNASDSLSQPFRVPDTAATGRLAFQFQMGTQESGGVYDVMRVRLRNSNNDLLRELASYDNTFTPANRWVGEEVLIDWSAYQGQTVRLSFEAATDSNLTTNFYLDEIYLSPVE